MLNATVQCIGMQTIKIPICVDDSCRDSSHTEEMDDGQNDLDEFFEEIKETLNRDPQFAQKFEIVEISLDFGAKSQRFV